jgi:hypothetical protein
MTKKIISVAFVAALFFGCASAFAVTAKVNVVGTYDDGSIYIMFDKAISDCSTTSRIDLPANNPSVKNVLSIAMTAFVTGSNVEIHPGSCSGVTPLFSTDGDSYFYLTK